MTIHDFPSPNASITTEEVEELMLSRLAGENNVHFYSRITRMATSKWLTAHRDTEMVRARGVNSETMKKFESQERKAKGTMTEYTRLLNEALRGETA